MKKGYITSLEFVARRIRFFFFQLFVTRYNFNCDRRASGTGTPASKRSARRLRAKTCALVELVFNCVHMTFPPRRPRGGLSLALRPRQLEGLHPSPPSSKRFKHLIVLTYIFTRDYRKPRAPPRSSERPAALAQPSPTSVHSRGGRGKTDRGGKTGWR